VVAGKLIVLQLNWLNRGAANCSVLVAPNELPVGAEQVETHLGAPPRSRPRLHLQQDLARSGRGAPSNRLMTVFGAGCAMPAQALDPPRSSPSRPARWYRRAGDGHGARIGALLDQLAEAIAQSALSLATSIS